MPHYRVLPPVDLAEQELRDPHVQAAPRTQIKTKRLLRLSGLIVGAALLTIVLLFW